MSQTTNGEQSQSESQNAANFTEGAQMNVANPVILLVGKTGAGKSTLGNLLLTQPHDDGPFFVSADMESVTKECGSAAMSIDGVTYNIVDTPGIFDTQQVTDEVLKEIARAVHKCAYGVKAILFVFEAKRFTAEQKNVLNGIRTFLGEDATDYIIAVFSHANKMQIKDRNVMRKAWNQPVRSFIQDIQNRWGISPNSDYFPPEDPIHQARLGEIKTFISGTRGVYTTEQLEKARQEQEEARRQKEKEEARMKQEYEEKLKESAKKEADEAHKRHIEQLKQEQKIQQEFEENLRKKERKEAEEHHRRMIEQMRQEQKMQQERDEILRRKERQEAEEMYRRRLADAEEKRANQERQEYKQLIEQLRKQQERSEEQMRQNMRQQEQEFSARQAQKEAEERYRGELESAAQEQQRQEYLNLIEESQRKQEESEQRYQELKNNPDDCFSLDTKVQLASGKFVEMKELQVGDRVCSNVRNGELEFSEVYLISHLGHYNYNLEMIKIEFTNSDGQKSQIRTTSTHCIFREDLSIMYAKDVVPGKTKILVLNKTNELIPVIVDDLTIEKDTGYISFYTRAGTVIADNVFCSCYDDCPQSQALMDLAFAPIRWWTKVLPSNHRQEDLHPYVKTLETAYLTWCGALKIGKQVLGFKNQ